MNISILHETPELVVINKPADLMVHSDGKNNEPTVVDWVREHYPEIGDVGESAKLTTGKIIARPGIVHRLDRDTSGVLIIAKTQEMFLHLKKQFQDHTIRKIYNAFVYGKVVDDEGVINTSIGKSRSDFRMWSAGRGKRGMVREAVTEFTIVQRFVLGDHTFTFVELRPRTGRTHQLRVHMKYLNHPIVADALYAGKLFSKGNNLGFERQALHAYKITFCDLSGKEVTVRAPFPDDFVQAQKKANLILK